MSLFVRVNCNFFSHRKTARLKAKIGEAALWLPVRLWAYAAEHEPDGNFRDYQPEEIAALVGYTGDAKAMLKALLEAGFMETSPLRIHDWAEYNGYHQKYSDRAKKAAAARWRKTEPAQATGDEGRTTELNREELNGEDLKSEEKRGHELTDETEKRRAKQCLEHTSGKQSASQPSRSEWMNEAVNIGYLHLMESGYPEALNAYVSIFYGSEKPQRIRDWRKVQLKFMDNSLGVMPETNLMLAAQHCIAVAKLEDERCSGNVNDPMLIEKVSGLCFHLKSMLPRKRP
jgi:hypothetical protein